MRIRRLYLQIAFLAVSVGSSAFALRAVVDEHRDVANYFYNVAATRLRLGIAAAGIMSADHIDKKVNSAIAQGDMGLAESYREMAIDQGITLSPETEMLYQNAKGLGAVLQRSIGGGIDGFVTGKGEDASHISGAIISDFTIYGDIRDLQTQVVRYLQDEEIDEFLVAISGIGLALSVGTYASAGAAAPAKFGVSVVKFAKTTGQLTERFSQFIVRTTMSAVPIDTIRRNLSMVPYSAHIRQLDAGALQGDITTAFRKSINRAELAKLELVFSDLYKIKSATNSTETAVRTLKLIETPRDLTKLRHVSEIAGKKTLAYADSMGRRLLDTAKSSIKFSAKLLAKYIWLLSSILASIVAAMFTVFAERLVSTSSKRLLYRYATKP